MNKRPEYLPSEQEVVDHIKKELLQEFLEEDLHNLLNCESPDQEIALRDLTDQILLISRIETFDETMIYLAEMGHDMISAVFFVIEAFRFDKYTQSQLKTMLCQIPSYGWDT